MSLAKCKDRKKNPQACGCCEAFVWSFFVYNGYNLLSLQMDMVMSQASETQLPMLKSSES